MIYGLILATLIVAVGVCLALSCVSIYLSGESPFTRESISAHFARIAIPACICILGMIGGAILSLFLPLAGGKIKPRRDSSVALKKLSAKLDLSACDEAIGKGIRKERKMRRWILVITAVVCALAFVYPLIWCLNPHHFSIEHLNRDIITASTAVLTAAAVAMASCMVAVLLRGVSVSREIVLVKTALAANSEQRSIPAHETSGTFLGKLTSAPRFVWVLRSVILAVGILFIVLGILNGGMADVLGKAIRICTECIGLG